MGGRPAQPTKLVRWRRVVGANVLHEEVSKDQEEGRIDRLTQESCLASLCHHHFITMNIELDWQKQEPWS